MTSTLGRQGRSLFSRVGASTGIGSFTTGPRLWKQGRCFAAFPSSPTSIRSFASVSPPRAPAPSSYTPVPFITWQEGGQHYSTDLYSRLLKERIILLTGTIEDTMAATIVASMLFLDADDPTKPISLYINSPGGSVTAGLSIYDTVQYLQSELKTICIGQACSMGSLLLAGGAPGQRYALPHSTIMLHQPSGGYAGQAADIAIHAKEMLRVRDILNRIYQTHLTGKKKLSLDDIEKLLDRDTFLSPMEALELGIIDEILDRRVKAANA